MSRDGNRLPEQASMFPARFRGLSAAEVAKQRGSYGENRLRSEAGLSIWRILLNQVKSPLVYIILVAAVVSLLLGEPGDFAIIMVVVVINVALGLYQEYRAQRTYYALKGLLKPTTSVIRDGRQQEIEVWELVPGDLVVLSAGDKAPGDGEILEANRLSLDEAILTGESEPVSKHELVSPAHTIPQASVNSDDARLAQIFMGSTVVTGRGLVRITDTGGRTELGAIAASLVHEEAPTPLQVRLAGFTKMLTWIVLLATVAVLVSGLFAGREFLPMLRVSITLAIAAVPEGLVIAVTVILVLGVQRILKRRGLVKRLLAVETLGSVTVICTDKTGTLTEGRMRVNRSEFADEKLAVQTMVLCNDLEGPVDIAVWEYAEAALPTSAHLLFEQTERLSEEVFSSETKYMATTVTGGEFGEQQRSFLKGAPEVVLGMCTLAAADRERILAEVDEWAADGLRLLGLASRHGGDLGDRSGYTWVGIVGMEDPIRDGVHESVRTAQRAGIAVKMITGDYLRTAQAIATEVGIARGDAPLEGAEIAGMSDLELRRRVKTTAVFARIRPQDKLRIIRALTAGGEITAMIGDGVNDAPALAQAHIGVVVGTASDVAKESADLILLDNNFRTIVDAVEEGRVIVDNARKVIAYILAGTFAEMLIIVFAMFLGWPAPLLIVQILWINLICDGPSDLVLGFEPKEDGVMDEPPRPVTEPLLTRLAVVLIVVIDVGSSAFALAVFGYFHLVLDDPVAGRSMVMASLAVNSMVYIFAYRSRLTPLFRMKPITANKPLLWAVSAGLLATVAPFVIPGLGDLLGVVPLSLEQWALVCGFAVVLLAVVEAAKAVAARRSDKSSAP